MRRSNRRDVEGCVGRRVGLRARRLGVSLIDAMLAMIVLGTIAAVAMRSAGASATAQLAASDRQTAARLAEALLAEVVSRPWGAATPAAGAVRSAYTDLWQFNGLDETPKDHGGTDLTSSSSGTWRQTVTLTYASPVNRADSGSDTGLTRITIKVYKNGLLRATRVSYRAKDN